jgi:hypothetical protein
MEKKKCDEEGKGDDNEDDFNCLATRSFCLHLSICSCCSHLEHRASVKFFVSLQFINLRQSVGLLGREISPTQGRYLHRTIQT